MGSIRFDLSQYDDWEASSLPLTITLPIGGVFLLNSALSCMSQRWQWHNGGVDLTDNEWDVLEEKIAALTLAIITGVSTEMQIGSIVAFPFNPNPPGGSDWLRCKGELFAKSLYPDLYDKVPSVFIASELYGICPSLGNAFIMGAWDDLDVGDEGGDDEHTLSVAEMPAHNHPVTGASTGFSPGSPTGFAIQSMGWTHTGIGIGNKGDGNAHNNLPPYQILEYWMKGR